MMHMNADESQVIDWIKYGKGEGKFWGITVITKAQWVNTSYEWVDSFLDVSTQSERYFQGFFTAFNVLIHLRNGSIY